MTSNVATQVEQGVQSDCGLGRAKRRPRKDRQVEINRGGIQRIDGVREFDTKRFIPVQRPGDADQRLRKVTVDAPITPGIGIRQGAARHRMLDAHVVQHAPLSTQTRYEVAQTLPSDQLRERHGQVLFAIRERLRLMRPVISSNARLKRPARQELHQLREYGLAFVHPGDPPSEMKKDTIRQARTSSRVRPQIRVSYAVTMPYETGSCKRPDTTGAEQ